MVDQPGTPEGVPITRTWTADASSARAMARVMLGVQQRQPQAWILHTAVVIGFFLVAVFTPVIGLVAAVVAAAVLGFSVWADYRGLLKALQVQFPAGEELAIGVGPTGMTVRASSGTSHSAYSTFRRFRLLSDYVLLENRVRGLYHLYPRELFSTEDLDHIRAAVPS